MTQQRLSTGTGRSVPSWTANRNEETLSIVRSQFDDAALAAAWDEGRVLTLDEALAYASEGSRCPSAATQPVPNASCA